MEEAVCVGLLGRRRHINLKREKVQPLVRVLGPGRWRPETGAMDGVSEGLGDWQRPAGGSGGGKHRERKAEQASWTTKPPNWEVSPSSKSEFPRPQPFSCFHQESVHQIRLFA